ncbi:MAG TPA: MBL fold metallo-hydrolase, partial [Gemmatimonadaceae bacterium]|nr:MBL fold metallo-hydrolase [Gemmatimonadaceae bacterium]
FDLVEGEREVLPGVRLIPTPGHTPHHQSILLTSAGESAFFAADLIPTHAHLPLPWIMGYDVEPLVTLESKRRVLARALAEGWEVVFEHDAEVAGGRLALDAKGYGLAAPPGQG